MKNPVSTPLRPVKLIPIKKDEQRNTNGKLVDIKKPEDKSKILLPPPHEKYIKVKEHDFL
jgi:hypothetical protein